MSGRQQGRIRLGSATALLLVLAGCSSGGSSITSQPPVRTLNVNGCHSPPAVRVHPAVVVPSSQPRAAATYTARIVTNCGTIIARLDGRRANRLVRTFTFLADRGSFSRVGCPQLITPASGGSVLQCGQPAAGTMAPVAINRTSDQVPAGTLAADPATGASFAVTYATSGLPGDDSAFGQVVAGLDVLTRIAGAGASSGVPHQKLVIVSIGVTRGRAV